MLPMVDHDLATDLLSDLARRAVGHPGPTWPVPIFEAEADLYPRFLRHMLDAFGTIAAVARRIDGDPLDRPPSRVIEFAYFLFGARHSGMPVPDRRRLVERLAQEVAILRPADPFCQRGGNVLLREAEVICLLDWQHPVLDHAEEREHAKTKAALLALVEFENLGVPQYGREIHGPYPVGSDGFALIRDHFGLNAPDLWPDTAGLSFDRVRVVETYVGQPAGLRFDISNHLYSEEPLSGRLVATAIQVVAPDGTIADVATHEIFAETTTLLARLRRSCQEFQPEDWFRLHHRSRYRSLRSHVMASGGVWVFPPDVSFDPLLVNERPQAPALVGLDAAELLKSLKTELGFL